MSDAQDKRSAFARQYLNNLTAVIDGVSCDDLGEILAIMEAAQAEGRCVYLAGNGGSAATASHIANDFLKTVEKGGGKGLRAMALADNTELITAIANDHDYSEIFSRQLTVLADPADVLIVISGSGNSPNLLLALKTAKDIGMKTIGFLGMDGGAMKGLVDASVIVPSHDYGPIEDVHLIFNHLITAYLSEKKTANAPQEPVSLSQSSTHS